MIVVKIELHSARTGKVTELGRLHIANDGTGTKSRGNYNVTKIGKRRRKLPPVTARVENFPRLSYSVFRLLRRALEAIGV